MKTYLGHIIHENRTPGHHLRYSALGIGASNTLAGIKRLIKRHVKHT